MQKMKGLSLSNLLTLRTLSDVIETLIQKLCGCQVSVSRLADLYRTVGLSVISILGWISLDHLTLIGTQDTDTGSRPDIP